MKKDYSEKLADIVRSFLDSNDYKYEFDEKDGVFEFCIKLNSKIKKLYYNIFILEDLFCVVADFDLRVNDDKLYEVAEYAHRVNGYSYFSKLIVNFDNKRICCECYTNCFGITPTEEILRESIASVKGLVEYYGDGLVDLIEGKGAPKEIFEKLLKEEPEIEY